MAYLVSLTARAERDLVQLYGEINAESSEAAVKWYPGFKEAILRLEEQPTRCPLTPESDKFRHLLYGNKPHVYRAIYRVSEKQKQVEVLHIRDGARRRSKGHEVAQAEPDRLCGLIRRGLLNTRLAGLAPSRLTLLTLCKMIEMTVNDLETLFDYGYWANRKLFVVLSQLTAEQFTQPVAGSYGSVRNTMVHVLSAEW
ncbi:MAG: toxin ParE1/3/4, partial [Bryobacterales bacterium]|nr:toxin ParE1/3/4 [Bryobacterales bacterium]